MGPHDGIDYMYKTAKYSIIEAVFRAVFRVFDLRVNSFSFVMRKN